MHLKQGSSVMDKYRVTLTPEERAELEHLISAGKAAARDPPLKKLARSRKS
jgi:hypothetical protein